MGDSACWMHEVCMDCGTIAEDRGPNDPCPNCWAEAEAPATPSRAAC